ncbi:hypothetical protein EJB05_02020, partial [Eragrostis curvula]
LCARAFRRQLPHANPTPPQVPTSVYFPSIDPFNNTTPIPSFPNQNRIGNMSSRIHPSNDGRARRAAPAPADRPAVYTVWKRSSMGFQGTDGFCVYDAAGTLAFRVDNYSRRRKLCAGELLLMDGHGTPLLSLRPQLLSLHDRWNCYTATTEESLCGKKQSPTPQLLFTMHRSSALQGSSDQAEVHMEAATTSAASSSLSCKHQPAAPGFRIEGSFSRRNCKILGNDGREAARISRKKAGVASRSVTTLGDDVFSLVVRPGVDASTVMAMVVIMDRICRKPYTPMVCSSQ